VTNISDSAAVGPSQNAIESTFFPLPATLKSLVTVTASNA
jgi:hypothetical protein